MIAPCYHIQNAATTERAIVICGLNITICKFGDFYLRQQGYVFTCVCLSVCLLLGLSLEKTNTTINFLNAKTGKRMGEANPEKKSKLSKVS